MHNAKQFLEMLESHGVIPNDKSYYITAMTHPSYAHEHHCESYQRLEFLGDAVLGFLMAEYLYNNRAYDEGVMTRIRAQYVCTKANAMYAQRLNLERYAAIGKGMLNDDNLYNEALMADLFEALLAAIYLDQGIDTVRHFLESSIFPFIAELHGDLVFTDYKTQLQELVQAKAMGELSYEIIKRDGPAHDLTFTVRALLNELPIGTGIAKTRKDAEQNAARMALERIIIDE